METDEARALESAVREVSDAIARLEKVRASFSTDWSVHSLAQPIRELSPSPKHLPDLVLKY
jgi:hypothetical protein